MRASTASVRRVDELIPAEPSSTIARVSVRVAQRVPDGDDAAERVAREHGRQRILPLCDPVDDLRERREVRERGDRGRAAVPGQVGDEHAVALRERRRHGQPVASAAPPSPWTSTTGGPATPPTK